MELSTVLTVGAIGLAIYYLLFHNLRYFKRLGVPYATPLPIIGNLLPYVLRRASFHDVLNRAYHDFSYAKYFGFFEFSTPVLVVRDAELISSIGIKNFDHFVDHRDVIDAKLDPLFGKNLFNLRGDTWREMRKLISPTFTSSKMKMMFKLLSDCGENFVDFIAKDAKDGKEVEIKGLVNRYATDVVATTAFGITVDSMRNPKNDFYVLATKTMTFDGILSLKFNIARNFPLLTKLFGVRVFGKNITKFFTGIVADAVKMREEKGISRPDMIQLMMEARKESPADLTIESMTSQAFVFFFAGFDVVSTFMSFLAHEMAVNVDAQQRLREEIDEVLRETNGQVTYDAVMGLRYLDAIVNETMRLYPLGSFLDRVCGKEFELPPVTPGAPPLKVPVGTNIWLPTYAIHRDPQFFPNPDKFDPDRFLSGEVNESLYFPFGIGPRFCIGNRFALMQAKVMLFHLLAKCELEPCSRTCIPMKFSEKSFVMLAKGGFWLKVRARKTPVEYCRNEINGTLKV